MQRNQHDQNDLMSNAANTAKNMMIMKAKKMAAIAVIKATKLVVKGVIKLLAAIIKAIAPIWVPVLLILLIIWGAYMIIYAIPRDFIEQGLGLEDRLIIAAFFGVAEDDEIVDANLDLLERYQEIAGRWDEGLTPEQRGQVTTHAFPWSLLLSIDRIVNDMAVWDGKENIELDPEGVFEALRPTFEWKDSTITITTRICEPDGEGGIRCNTTVEVQNVRLVTRASTLKGEFTYTYRWQTERTHSAHGGYVEIVEEIIDDVIIPEEFFIPLREFLKNERGITDEHTIELIMELAFLFDAGYMANYFLLLGFDPANFPTIEGSYGWIWPTPSTRTTSQFGPRRHPITGQRGHHTGVDIAPTASGANEPIWSMADGTVVFTGWRGAFGNTVIVQHDNDVHSMYAHLHTIAVRQGDRVTAGTQLLGTMGTTGQSTGVHLHFEIWIGGHPVNPMPFFAERI